jgi:geranylgeranyl diphosphate synthase type II
MKDYLPLVEEALDRYSGSFDLPELFARSMRYSLLSGGKRIRACLCLACCELVGGRAEDALPFAAALEMIHAYSLIHDDLPAMDDDDMRRGKPSSHKAFGEGNAILAGDGLLTMAMRLLCDVPGQEAAKKAIFQGALEMAAGQSLDLNVTARDRASLQRIHDLKTGALFRAACLSGAYRGGCDEADASRLRTFADKLGLLFQMTDDLLDQEKDEAEDKLTYVTLLGAERTRQEIQALTQDIRALLAGYEGEAATCLLTLTDRISTRKA